MRLSVGTPARALSRETWVSTTPADNPMPTSAKGIHCFAVCAMEGIFNVLGFLPLYG